MGLSHTLIAIPLIKTSRFGVLGSRFAAGVYFYRLEADGNVATQAMVIDP
jgi:hypothetical protein